MKKTTAGTLLRILTFVAVAFYIYGLYKTNQYSDLLMERKIDFDTYIAASHTYNRFRLALPIILGMDILFTIFYRKSDREGRINVKKEVFPEFNYDDEREALVTGRAAKVSLSIIYYYTFAVLWSFILFMPSVPYLLFATASIPIAGLIAYLVAYKVFITK